MVSCHCCSLLCVALLAAATGSPVSLRQCDVNVAATGGSDLGQGSPDDPLATLHEAARRLQVSSGGPGAAVATAVTAAPYVICVGPGVHRIGSPLRLDRSHNRGGPVVWRGAPDGSTVLNGGVALTKWYRCNDVRHP